MITVTILINGQPIFTRSAVNVGQHLIDRRMTKYKLDDGTRLYHKREDGAVPLAIKMLQTIVEHKAP